MAENDTPQMKFDNAPVEQDTPAQAQPQSQPQQDQSGMKFDATPVANDTPAGSGEPSGAPSGGLYMKPDEDSKAGAEASFPQGEEGNRTAGTGVIAGMGEEISGLVKSLPKAALGAPGMIIDQLRDVPSQYRAYEAARQKGLPPSEAMKVVQAEVAKKGNAMAMLQDRFKELMGANTEVAAQAIGKTIVALLPIALGLAKGAGAAPEAIPAESMAETVDRVSGAVRPTAVPIAGENVPVSSLQTAEPGAAAKAMKPFATAEGAEKMINEVIQPKAVKATVANLGKSAVDDVNTLRTIRGEDPLVYKRNELSTIDDAHRLAKEEAQKTYRPLDSAVNNDMEAWDAKTKDWQDKNPQPLPRPKASPSTDQKTAGSKQYDTEAFKAEKQYWADQKEAFDAENPKPKTFTQLQDQVIKAERDIKLGSQEETQKAIENLPKYEKEIKAFTDKHSDLVAPNELDAANALYRKSKQYEFIADKINPVLRGTEGTVSPLKHVTNSISLETLEGLPGKMKVEFGNASNPDPMARLLGTDGMNNYNTVIESLKNPISGKETILNWALAHQTGLLGQAAGVPVIKALVNKMLFDPEFGSRIVSGWRATAAVTKTAAKLGTGAVVTDQQATHKYNPDTKKIEPFTIAP